MSKIETLVSYLEKTPNDNFLRHALALEFEKIGNYNQTKSLFEAILTESPDYVGSYYHLGKVLEKLNEKEAALDWYEKGMTAAKQAKDQHAYNELQAAYDDLADS